MFDNNNDKVADWRVPEIATANHYYPFGMLMPGRTLSVEDYRFGFNDKENLNDVKGVGKLQDYGIRIYDPRLAKFLSVDPILAQFPHLTPYQFSSNNPIFNIDLDGLEGVPSRDKKDGTTTAATSSTFVMRVDPSKSNVPVTHNPSSISNFFKGIDNLFPMGNAKVDFGVEFKGPSNGNKANPTTGPTLVIEKETIEFIEGLLELGLSRENPVTPKSHLTDERNTGTSDRMEPKGKEKMYDRQDASKESEKNSTSEDTTITISTKKNMNSWFDGNTTTEWKDTTVKKEDLPKVKTYRDETKTK